MFSVAVGGPHHGHLWSLEASFSHPGLLRVAVSILEHYCGTTRMLRCGYSCTSSCSFQMLCLALQVKRSQRNQRIIPGSVTARDREVFFVVPSSLPKKQHHHAYHAYNRVTHSWSMRATITNVCPWCQLVFSNRTLQRYVTYRNDWKLELAVQNVRGVNMKQSLRRPWYVRCVNMRLGLCLIFWNTQETTLIVATRGAISSNLQQNWVPDRNVPFLLKCAATDTIVPPNSTQGGSLSEAPAQGEREGAEGAKQGTTISTLGSRPLSLPPTHSPTTTTTATTPPTHNPTPQACHCSTCQLHIHINYLRSRHATGRVKLSKHYRHCMCNSYPHKHRTLALNQYSAEVFVARDSSIRVRISAFYACCE